MREIALYLPEPPSANRWWRRSGTHMHLSTEAKAYKENVALYCLTQRVQKIAAPEHVHVEIHWWRGRKSGDLDKRIGIALDALQGTCYDNDSQITSIAAHRHDAPKKPQLVIHISPAL